MKRLVLIAGALFLVSGTAIGAYIYFAPKIDLAETLQMLHPGHAVAEYANVSDEKSASRKRTLQLVEELGSVQDRIIRGDHAAIADQARLLSEIAKVVRGFTAEDWRDYVKVRATFVYVLSGGDPGVLKPFVDGDTPNAADRRLAEGIVSYAKGQVKAARRAFDDVDPRSLDISLVGPFALARASLYLEKDAEKAIRLLDDARLASPHTAIEEAAARREIPLLISSGNVSRGMMLASDYVRRFGKSIYARKLFHDLADAVVKRDDLDTAKTVTDFLSATEGADRGVCANLMLDLAGQALLQGRLTLAGAAASAALDTGTGSREAIERAKLYKAAAEAPSTKAAHAFKVLDEIPASGLSAEDQEIRAVALYISKIVASGIPNSVSNEAATNDQTDADSKPDEVVLAQETNVTSALEHAEEILKQADQLTSGRKK
jgi:chemotaxis protein MotC